ncbi:MAG: glycosyltransferase [Candidatus Dormibacteraeota bacterium]|nr:glycosyltransferase [Candidatus Dormibacteraeota bacterium]
MNVFLWHVHGSWTTAFVQGRHRYLVPVLPDRGPDGLGRAATWTWPESVEELPIDQAQDAPVDLVLLQRPHEIDLVPEWLGGRRPGIDVPAVYVEHNTPRGRVEEMLHPLAGRPEILLVHVTNFNRVFWDNGDARVEVVEHGVVDPGPAYTGELERCAVVVNEPVRRRRVAGIDLLPELAGPVPVDLFGIGTDRDLPQSCLHREMARRRLYLHAYRWTSLGLALVEAMHLGMPVVAFASTEAVEAVPPGCGVVSTDPRKLREGVERLRREPDRARELGRRAREQALARYGLNRFLRDWDQLLSMEVAR